MHFSSCGSKTYCADYFASRSQTPSYVILAQYPVTISKGYNLLQLDGTLLMPVNTMIVIEQISGFIAADDYIVYQYDDFLFDPSRVSAITGIDNPKIRFYARPLYSCKNTQTISLNKTYQKAGVYNLTVNTDLNPKISSWKEITVINVTSCK